jgi:CBS domain-containing protein
LASLLTIESGCQERKMGGKENMSEQKVRTEEFQVSGDALVAKIKELLHEGNIRRLIIKNEEDRVLIDIPLTIGVVGVLVAPQLAAIGAIAALITHGSIVVEKVEE